MSPALKVLAPGSHTTVQDLGRTGFQAIGIPVSGALDHASLRLGNLLVGNSPETAALEILYQGPTLEVCADTVRVALTGTGATLDLLGDDEASLPPWRSALLRRGQVFRIGALADSSCCYLAIEGGLDLKPCLGSLSTYVRGGFGGFEGRMLRVGDEVPLVLEAAPERPETRLHEPLDLVPDDAIRIVLGPQQELFPRPAIDAFLAADYTVSLQSDRMGMRLDGPALQGHSHAGFVSDGIATGAIQVPGSGQPIVLLADHQTTGGYPKIATVISADIPVIGRRKPGDGIRFAAIDVAAAENIRRAQEDALEDIAAHLEPAPAVGGLDLGSLYARNLISGVVSGSE